MVVAFALFASWIWAGLGLFVAVMIVDELSKRTMPSRKQRGGIMIACVVLWPWAILVLVAYDILRD